MTYDKRESGNYENYILCPKFVSISFLTINNNVSQHTEHLIYTLEEKTMFNHCKNDETLWIING